MSSSAARSERIAAVGELTGFADEHHIRHLLSLACTALPAMYQPEDMAFVQTVRRDDTLASGLRPEGMNLRYAAIAALGLHHVSQEQQRQVLSGRTAAELTTEIARRARSSGELVDLGAAALCAWAEAELTHTIASGLFDRLVRDVKDATPQPTVDYAWTLTALLAGSQYGEFSAVAEEAAERLMASQGPQGIFPHHLPRETLGRYRAHVGCFADQVYPIQALARYYAATGDNVALEAANRCAKRIVELQGSAGQWWWHYDVRTGEVVEGFPVYSVHQHAMAPMALFDLAEAGGDDHRVPIALGLQWLSKHPESPLPLIDDVTGAIWRKIRRNEPAKAARRIRAVTTSINPKFRIGLLDKVFTPGSLDYECRPYELGWLLYAWQSDGVVRDLVELRSP